LGIFKSKRLSAGDLSLSFGAIAFPVHVWAIINILAIFPAWVLRLSIWELAGAIGYALLDALLESCIVWIALVALSLILPRTWLASKFLALSSALAWLLAAWAALVQFNYDSILQWGPEQTFPGLALVAFSFGLVCWVVQRYVRVEGWIKRLTRGLAVLTYVYMTFDLLGLAVVILRNLLKA
jgi:hypothetical protein